jgi:hypothetical protein
MSEFSGENKTLDDNPSSRGCSAVFGFDFIGLFGIDLGLRFGEGLAFSISIEVYPVGMVLVVCVIIWGFIRLGVI